MRLTSSHMRVTSNQYPVSSIQYSMSSQDPGVPCALSTPRISLVGLKAAVQHVGTSGWYCGEGCAGRWVYRVGYWVGIPGGCYTGYPAGHRLGPGNTNVAVRHCRDVRGHSRPCRPSAHPLLGIRLRTSIWARFHHKYTKVSHESGVSPKYGDEAWHTPSFKKPE